MSGTRDCRGIETELALFVGGEIAARDRARLHEHLAGCAECAELVERLRRARAALRTGLAHGDQRVPDLWPGVRARLDLRPVSPQPAPIAAAPSLPRVRRLPRWVPLGAAAAAVFAFGLWMGQHDSNQDRSSHGDRVAQVRPAPLPVHSIGLRRLAPEETPLSLTPGAGGVDQPQDNASWFDPRSAGGAEAASLRSRPPGYH